MKFKVDENLPEELTQLLREAGWDCSSVIEQELGGVDDPRVAQVCASEDRILVTFDRGFSNIKVLSAGASSRDHRIQIEKTR